MTGSPAGLGPWSPLSVAEVAALFAAADVPWWIAGGHAIELFTGVPRPHGDIDVLMLHRDQAAVHRIFPGWDCRVADPPGSLRAWPPTESLAPDLHDIWCRPTPVDPWRLQVMLDNSDGADWVSRRHADIRRPITSIGAVTEAGVPYLRLEIQLFYKAKTPRPKDEQDFAAALPMLPPAARSWLDEAIRLAYPK